MVPAKDTDARFEGYQDQFGDSSWELDALDPTVIEDLIQDELSGIIDADAWENAVEEQRRNKALLGLTRDRWSDVVEFLTENFGDDLNEPDDDEDDA